MLRFGPVEIAPEHEPPRPAVHAYWRDLEAIDEFDDSGDDAGEGEGPGSTLPWESIDVGVERQPLGAPGTMPVDDEGSPGGGYDPGDGDLAADVILNIGEPPQLSDYLARCEEDEDGCEGRTFETMDSGVLNWTEPGGENGTTVEHKVTKDAGRITRIERITRAPRILWMPRLSDRTRAFEVIRPKEWTVITNDYYTCCPQALRRTVEETYVADIRTEFPAAVMVEVAGGVDDWRDLEGVHLDSRREVVNRYQAEGWLRHRLTIEMEVASWEFTLGGSGLAGYDFNYYPLYRKRATSETFTPVGGGRWLIHTSETTGVFRPVVQHAPGVGAEYELVGADWNVRSNSYTIETDQAPPTVTCTPGGEEGETCEERAEREWRKARDEYDRRLEQYRAGIVNAPPIAMRQSLRTRRHISPTLGQVASGPAGPGIVVGLGYDGRRSGDGEPEDTASMQLLSRIT